MSNNHSPSFLVLSGDGLNCEIETAKAIEMANGKARIVHVNDLINEKITLKHFQGLAIPGGFSFGDELGAGTVLGLKLKYSLANQLKEFFENKKPIIGICNGFQVLLKLGLLPSPQQMFQNNHFALTSNQTGQFVNKWVQLTIPKESKSKWLLNMNGKEIFLPIRNGGGRLICSSPKKLNEVLENGCVALQYKDGVTLNGSMEAIAGLSDPEGLILGLMPHPEVFTTQHHFPHFKKRKTQKLDGLNIFKNIIYYLNNC